MGSHRWFLRVMFRCYAVRPNETRERSPFGEPKLWPIGAGRCWLCLVRPPISPWWLLISFMFVKICQNMSKYIKINYPSQFETHSWYRDPPENLDTLNYWECGMLFRQILLCPTLLQRNKSTKGPKSKPLKIVSKYRHYAKNSWIPKWAMTNKPWKIHPSDLIIWLILVDRFPSYGLVHNLQ